MIRLIVSLFFTALIICLFVSAIVSWIPNLGQDNPIVRFFTTITAPLLNPVVKRLPRMTIGMFDLTYTVAFFFIWWVLGLLGVLVTQALPVGW